MKQYLAIISIMILLASCGNLSSPRISSLSSSTKNNLVGKTYLAPIPEQFLPYINKIEKNSGEINELLEMYPMKYTFLGSGIFLEKPAIVTPLWISTMHLRKSSRYYFDDEGRLVLIRYLMTVNGATDVYFRCEIYPDSIVITQKKDEGDWIWRKMHEVLTLQ